ncbi:MAG TPA: hypothetical protein VFU60_07165 [Ktedonobacterales bacterium]|nr:hypothetical protein [Ktedonobacterales bacterium]
MNQDSPAAGAGAASAPLTAVNRVRSYPLWACLSLGALSCVGWLGAIALDQRSSAVGLGPGWLHIVLRVALVVAIPTFILAAPQRGRLPGRRYARVIFALEALLTALTALAALLPYLALTDAQALSGLALRVPTISLGVALAAVEWRQRKIPDASTAVAAGVGFGAVIVVVGIAMVASLAQTAQCTGNQLACGALANVVSVTVVGAALACVVASIVGAWLGYALGAVVASLTW